MTLAVAESNNKLNHVGIIQIAENTENKDMVIIVRFTNQKIVWGIFPWEIAISLGSPDDYYYNIIY